MLAPTFRASYIENGAAVKPPSWTSSILHVCRATSTSTQKAWTPTQRTFELTLRQISFARFVRPGLNR